MAKRKQAVAADPVALGKIPREWSWFASGPLLGCALMRERCRTVVWDTAGVVTALDAFGTPFATFACPQPLAAVAVADTGHAVLAVGRSGGIWWLDGDLELQFARDRPGVPLDAALDTHGQYAAVSFELGQTIVFGADNRDYATLETRQGLRRLAWTAEDGYLFGAAANGAMGLWDYRGREFWNEGLWINVAGAAVAGDAEAIFLACPQQGILRFNMDGKREGAYRIDGLPTLVAADYAGRRLVAATDEKKLVALTYHGVVEGSRIVRDEVVGLQVDALGRFVVWATRAGEVQFAALDDFAQVQAAAENRSGAGGNPQPAWQISAAATLDEAAGALLEPIPGTELIALLTSNRKVRIVAGDGQLRHETAGIPGIGRALRGGHGWLAITTDSQAVAYDPATNMATAATYPVFDTSHAEPFGAPGDLLLVSSCEYVARVRLPEDEAWKFRAEEKIDAVATQPDGSFAATGEDRRARFYGPRGECRGSYAARPAEPLAVAALADGCWATLGRNSRTLRGHEPDGKLLWSTALPWAPWGLRALGGGVVAVGDRGESMLVDAAGTTLATCPEPRLDAHYAFDPAGDAVRVYVLENTLVATDFAGKVRWRHAAEKPVAAIATNGRGVWAVIGKTLSWFPFGA